MKTKMSQKLNGRTHPPTRQDRLVVLFLSVGIFFVLLPIARNIHPQIVGWIVIGIVVGLPVVTINILLSFSRWMAPSIPDEGPRRSDQNKDQR